MKRYAVGAVVAVAALVLTACGSSSSPTGSSTGSSSASAGSLTIGSGNFPEAALLGNIYAAALKAKGVNVTLKLNTGSREVYIPALKDGSLDLVPEYSGSLLAYLKTTSTAVSSADVLAALQTSLPTAYPTLQVLDQSTAQDSDQIVVTQATATKYNLKTIADLAPVAGTLTFGAAPEFKTRNFPALKDKYGVTFGTFKELDTGGPLTVNALKNSQIDAGDVYSTDSAMVTNKFVALTDPKNLFAAQNILPLITKSKVTPTISDTLNAISAKLDTASLTTILAKVQDDKQDSAKVASDWLKSVGLIS